MNALVGTGIGVLLVLALACGPALLDRSRHIRRRGRRTPLTPMGGLREGQLARVAGRIELVGQPLRSPIEDRCCAGWRVLVSRLDHDGEIWREQLDAHDVGTIRLRDSEHVVDVDLDGADLAFELGEPAQSGATTPLPKRVTEFFEQHGVHDPGHNVFYQATYRVSEAIVEAGMDVWVIGVPVAQQDSSFRLVAPPGGRLTIAAVSA